MKSLERREASRNYYHLAILTLMARGCLASAGKCWNPAILWPTQVWPLLIFSQFWNCSGNSKQPPIACLRTIPRHKQSERACLLPVALFNAQHPWFLKKTQHIPLFPKICLSSGSPDIQSMYPEFHGQKVYGGLFVQTTGDSLVYLNLREQKQATNAFQVLSSTFLLLVWLHPPLKQISKHAKSTRIRINLS